MPIPFSIRKMFVAACLTAWLPLVHAADEPQPGMSMPPAGHGPSGRMAESPVPPFLQGVELNEAQRDEVFSIGHDQIPLLRKHDKALHAAREKLQAIVVSAQYDEAKGRALAETIAKETQELTLLRARSEQKIYALLSPAQRKQIEERQQRRQASADECGPGGRMLPPSAGRPAMPQPR